MKCCPCTHFFKCFPAVFRCLLIFIFVCRKHVTIHYLNSKRLLIYRMPSLVSKSSTVTHMRISLRPATLLKRRLWHRCFPVNFAKFLRAPFIQNTSGRVLLQEVFHRKAPRKHCVWVFIQLFKTFLLCMAGVLRISFIKPDGFWHGLL